MKKFIVLAAILLFPLCWGSGQVLAADGKEHLQPVFHLLFSGTIHITPVKSLFSQNEEISVRLTNMPGNAQDWVGIYPQGAASDWGNQVGWSWANHKGTQEVTIKVDNLVPGIYEARVFFNNSFTVEATCSFLVYDSTMLLQPVFSDAGDLPELTGDQYGAMGEHPVRKISINSPWPAYADKDYLKVDLIVPADMTGKRPTVFFITGYSIYHSESYYSLLYFIASQGYNCVFVPHEQTNPDFQPDLLLTILDGVVDKFAPIIDTTRVGYVGHSEGGGLIFYLAKDRPQWGTNGRFLFSLAAWWGFNLPETGNVEYPPNTNMIVQMGDPALDTGTDPRQNIDLLLHNNIPAARKTYLYLPGDAVHPATHRLSYSSDIDIGGPGLQGGIAHFNALQQVGLLRPLESLMRYSFENDTVWKKIGLPKSGDANYNTMYTLNGITVLSTDDPLGNHEVPIPVEASLATDFLCRNHDPYGYNNPRWQMCMPCGDTDRDASWQQCQ